MNAVRFQKEGHKYFDASGREVPSVSAILAHFGISQIESVRKFIGDAAVDASSEFGTVVHDTCTLYDMDDLAECDPLVVPYLTWWKKYRADYGPHFTHIEKPMLSKVWGFAGTPDRIINDDDDLHICDIKTGAKTVAEEIQTAMYQILSEENIGVKVTKRYSIHISGGGYKIVPHHDKGNIQTAKSLLVIYNFKKQKGIL